MHHNPTVITGNEITVIYLMAKGKQRQQSNEDTLSRIHTLSVGRIVLLLGL